MIYFIRRLFSISVWEIGEKKKFTDVTLAYQEHKGFSLVAKFKSG